MPGYLDRITRVRCPLCAGWDMGSAGLIHHKHDCPRSPCIFCSLEVMPGEKRTLHNGFTVHYDCLADFELDGIDDQEARRG
jgi:hypothetical protein